jgi:hypothetical protein
MGRLATFAGQSKSSKQGMRRRRTKRLASAVGSNSPPGQRRQGFETPGKACLRFDVCFRKGLRLVHDRPGATVGSWEARRAPLDPPRNGFRRSWRTSG